MILPPLSPRTIRPSVQGHRARCAELVPHHRAAAEAYRTRDVTLQLQLPVLTPQPDEFVTLGRRQAQISRRWLGFPPALAAVGLRDPVADRLRGGLELARQISRITTGADQLDHLAAELGRVCRTGSGHRETPHAKAFSVSTCMGLMMSSHEATPLLCSLSVCWSASSKAVVESVLRSRRPHPGDGLDLAAQLNDPRGTRHLARTSRHELVFGRTSRDP